MPKVLIWLRAVRPFTLTASIIPVIMGGVLALKDIQLHLGYLFLSLLAMLMIHAGVNVLNDHDDYLNGVDTKESFGGSRVIVEKELSPLEASIGGNTLVILGAVLGIYLAISRGWFILLIGLFGIAAVYTYTGKPLSLKYRGLGLAIIFLIFGPCALLGSYYVQMQTLSFDAILISVPIGFLTTAILQANDLRDMQFDKLAGIKTLSLIIGNKKGYLIYKNLIIMPYVLVVLMIITRYLPYWSCLVAITLPIAYRNIKLLNESNEQFGLIVDLDKKTAQLQAQFGVLFVVTVLLSLIHL